MSDNKQGITTEKQVCSGSTEAPCSVDRLRVLDLFSGIGGFSLGLERAGMETVAFCEIDEFCCKVLRKHWPDVPIYNDVRGVKNYEADVVVGGFPCQPFSSAGNRKGKEDDRYLWPEMFRVIGESRPTWVIAENVVGLLRMGIDTMLLDLETIGYTTRTVIIPACAANAPHRRDRIWILAYSEGNGDSGKPCKMAGEEKEAQKLRVQSYYKGTDGRRGGQRTLEPAIRRILDGIPTKLDRNRIKALGNAVHPQIPEMIGRAILAQAT